MNANSPNQGVFRGKLGSTSRDEVLVTSDTGESFRATIVRSIDVVADPELLDRLAAGELHLVSDPLSDAVYRLAVPVVCHDPVRRIMALVIPDSLRWDEFRLRAELLDELSQSDKNVPAYARNFRVVYDAARVASLEDAIADEPTTVQQAPSERTDLAASKDLARQRAKLDEERKQLEVEREQLNEVRGRFDRERQQMDDLQAQLQTERAELDKLKAEIEVERQQVGAAMLNQEAVALSGTSSVPPESTQVVTDDQFIEVVDEDEVQLADDDSSVVEEIIEDVGEVQLVETAVGVPDDMSDVVSSNADRAVKIVGDRIVALARVTPGRVEGLFDGDPTFFVQLHDVDHYPVVSLLIARLDERQQPVDSYAWPLDPAADGDRLILERLRKRARLFAAFYGPTNKRLRSVEIRAPFAENVDWILDKASQRLAKRGDGTWEKAKKIFEGGDFERLGSMRHNFTPASFEDATSPSKIKLAAGIVGYWSNPDTFEYLVANRCFPIQHFRAIQERVVRRATAAGIFLNPPLRKVAVELGIAPDEPALVELLVANFAEAAISIRQNDLEPAEQWENWDALLTVGEELGVPPDPEVVELAEVSLKRAQELEELAERSEAEAVGLGATIEEPRTGGDDDEGTLIVAKRSESTGVTYFLPGDAVLDTFDDLASMPRNDLELLLNDANGRLEAAQMLIERFGASATQKVMDAAEQMNAPEVGALARFLESKAGGLEGELVRCVESGGPSATYVAARALAKVRSTSALPTLIDALQDPERQGDIERFAEALADYGEKLLPALTRAIKRDGPKESLVVLLTHIEDHVEGTLAELSKDRSKNLREAARLARERRESKSA